MFLHKINALLDPRANASLNQAAARYLDADNLDPGWGQVKKLAATNVAADLGGPFLKERKKKDACQSGRVYELLGGCCRGCLVRLCACVCLFDMCFQEKNII